MWSNIPKRLDKNILGIVFDYQERGFFFFCWYNDLNRAHSQGFGLGTIFFLHFKPYKPRERFMIMLSPVPQNGDVSSAADVHYFKLWILSRELFLVVMSGSLKD